jgi:hypothetical protein
MYGTVEGNYLSGRQAEAHLLHIGATRKMYKVHWVEHRGVSGILLVQDSITRGNFRLHALKKSLGNSLKTML